MASEQDGIIRVSISRGGRDTKVSLDGLLFEWLCHRHGGVLGAEGWIRRSVNRIEVMLDEGDPTVSVGRAGFSRLMQRLVVLDIISATGAAGRGFSTSHGNNQTALLEALKEMDARETGGAEEQVSGVAV